MKNILYVFLMTVSLFGCTSLNDQLLGTKQTQVEMRNYQSRAFDTTNRSMVIRAVISTMQDLGFLIDSADSTLGVVSGTSFKNESKLSVSVRQIGKQVIVRANAQKAMKAITEPVAYQNFFNSLSQSLFLEAHEVQ